MEITINPFLAKIILRINPFSRLFIMCKGYNEDYINFTELVWQDDKDLNFYDKKNYPKFQLWFI
jgi:hypothetical protein